MNLELAQEQVMLRDSLERLLQRDSTSNRIRAAEPLGFDPALWRELADLGLPVLRVPEEAGGAGLSLLDAVVVAELVGTYLASAPLIETIVANQALARVGGSLAESYLAAAAEGSKIVTVALHPVEPGVPQLVPAGAVADWVICTDGKGVYLAEVGSKPEPVANLGTFPLAKLTIDLSSATLLGDGAEHVTAWKACLEEWKLLVAACVSAIGKKALTEAAAYANERTAFGQLIGSYQVWPIHSPIRPPTSMGQACCVGGPRPKPTRRFAQHMSRPRAGGPLGRLPPPPCAPCGPWADMACRWSMTPSSIFAEPGRGRCSWAIPPPSWKCWGIVCGTVVAIRHLTGVKPA